MKLNSLNVQNFLGVRAVDVPLTKPVTLFAGKNGAGKSSLQEAVRMALTGESVRVGMKKDYGQLVTEGAESGFAEVTIDGAVRAFVTLPDGKTTPLTEYVPPTALPYVLDAQRFAKMDANERRGFLFGLMGLSAGGAEVKKRLLAKGCNDQKVETIAPMLRAGFDTAHKEAQAKARDEKAAWRTITGETYGDKKAATWAAEKPAFDAAALGDLQQKLEAANADLSAANQRIGALQSNHKRHTEAAHRLAELREKGSRYARISDKLVRDEAELKDWEKKVADLKGSEHSQNALPCPDCGVMLVLKDGALVHAAPLAKGTDDDLLRLPEYEKALRLLQSAVANGQRDLAEADAAARAVTEFEAAAGTAPDEAEINAAKDALGEIARKQQALSVSLDLARDAERKAKQADERTAKALAAHEAVLAWLQIADALAPDGIPGEMLSEALTPLNERLETSSEVAEWMAVSVGSDMEITATTRSLAPETRPYALLSESEKWRADAMLAEAVAHLSKIKLLVLDRFDVLDMKGREDLIAWLDILAQNGEVDTALIFGTLKALPANLPPTMQSLWLEDGVIQEVQSCKLAA